MYPLIDLIIRRKRRDKEAKIIKILKEIKELREKISAHTRTYKPKVIKVITLIYFKC